MADVTVISGDPAGLTTALFAAKNRLSTTVFDTDRTWIHKAHLSNYPGTSSIDGSNYMETLRTQVDRFNAGRHQDEEVTGVSESDDRFVVVTDDGEHEADYVVLATDANHDLAKSFDCTFDDDLVDVDMTTETSTEDAYATGTAIRAKEWQAVISTGDDAAVALNILLKEKGEHYHNFGVPAGAESVFGSLIDEI